MTPAPAAGPTTCGARMRGWEHPRTPSGSVRGARRTAGRARSAVDGAPSAPEVNRVTEIGRAP